MPTIRIFRRRIRDSIRARRLDRDLQQQIASHLDEAAEEYVRRGLSPADARRAALRRFGDVARVHEAWRDARSFLALESLKRDVRHATRSLRRNPGFSFVVMGVLAIGTGALTFVFALLNGVVLRPLPFAAPDRLVVVRHSVCGIPRQVWGWTMLESPARCTGSTRTACSRSSCSRYTRNQWRSTCASPTAEPSGFVSYASARLFEVLRT